MSKLELIITLVILGIMAGSATLRPLRVDIESRIIAEEFRLSSLKARLLEEEIKLVLYKNELRTLSGKRLHQVRSEVTHVSFGNLQDQKNVIAFRPNGTTSAGRIVLKTKKQTCNLTQSIYGRIKIRCI